MAIFHCAVSHGSRKDGQSGAAKVDYIMRTGKYSRDPGELLGACAGHLPSWAGGNPRVFFAAADEYERSNGRLFTQVLFAIPNGLSDEDSLQLAYHYAEAVTENGASYALAVHRGGVEVPEVESAEAAPEEANEADLPSHNRHGHLVICERIDDGIERTTREWFRRANKKEPALGGAPKDREMNGGNWVPEVRHLCAHYINYGLKRAGFSERVTCESHETRIARAEAAGDEETAERLRLNPPGIHLGPTAWAIEKGRKGRKGRTSWRGDLNRTIAAEGEKLRGKVEELNAKLSQLDDQERVVTEKLKEARRVAAAQFEQREKVLQGTSVGGEILRAARVEMVGESAAPPSVVRLGEMLEVVEERCGAALDLREAGFRETALGSRYLGDATQSILGEEQSPTLPQRELIITTAESRLEEDLDRREASLRASMAGAEVLDTVQFEQADEDGSVLTLVQREQLIDTAERRLERREAEEEVRRGLDRREEVLRSMSTGTHHLSATARELFGEGKQAGTLAEREQLIGEAERRVEEELRGREEKLRSVSLGAQYLSEAEQEGFSEGKRAAVLAARDVIVTKAEQRLEADLSRRESDLVATSLGPALLREAFGERGDRDARLSFAARDRGLEQVETRVGEALTIQEEALRSIPFGRQCLPEETRGRSGDAEGVAAPLAERESRVRVAEQRVGEELDRLEKEHVVRAGHEDLLVEAAGALGGDGRTLSLGERWEVYERAQSRFEEEQRKLDREEAEVRKDPAGEEFLRNARHEVIGDADREVTLAERARIVKAAAALQQQAEQERETRLWEEQRDAGFQALSRQPGGGALYDAHLADLDPKWDRKRNNSSSREHIDAALAAAGSDTVRLGRLRVVLSNEVDAARYREELGKVAGQFKTSDLDNALAVADQEREKRETRLREEQEAAAAKKRVARIEELFTVDGGDKALISVLGAHRPAWRETGTGPADIDIVLDVAELRVDRTKPAPDEHAVVVDTEKSFPDTPSAALRQVGERFPEGSTQARLARRLADRTLVRALAAEREESPVSPTVVQRLFTWLRAQVDKLLERLKRKEKYEEQVRHAAAVGQENLPAATSHLVDDVGFLVAGQMFGRLKERARDGYVRDTISEVERDQCSKDANHPVGAEFAADARDAAVQDHLTKIAEESHRILIAKYRKASRERSRLELPPTLDVLMRKETERHESQLLMIFEAACDQVRPLQQHGRSVSEAPAPPPEVVPELPQQQGEDATVAAARAKEERLKKEHERWLNRGWPTSFEDFKKIQEAPFSENTGVVAANRPAPQTGETPAQAPADRARNDR